jgi:hypothetical protein
MRAEVSDPISMTAEPITVEFFDEGKQKEEEERERVSIHNDVYNLFFMSETFSMATLYSFYVFCLKMALYSFLAVDILARTDRPDPEDVHWSVFATQFLMLPIAVAMQDDLMATFYVIANVKGPNEWKFFMATAARAVDGTYSLIINYVVLMSADKVLNLFLNFAALQFLQTIDNIALDLAARGFLSESLEEAGVMVQNAELPKRSEGNRLRCLDTVLFEITVGVLFVVWSVAAYAKFQA